MITISQMRSRMNLPPSKDGELETIRAEVIAAWETATGRLWERRVDHVEVIRPRHQAIDTILLELRPVEAVSKVEVRYDGDDWEETTDYQVDEHRLIHTAGYWPDQVRVTYTGGYVATPGTGQATTPADVAMALHLQAHFVQIRMAPERIATKSQNFEGGQGVFEEATHHPYFAQLARAKRRLA